MDTRIRRLGIAGAAVLLLLGTTSCLATRRYVKRRAIEPLNAKIQTVDKKADTLDTRITELDRKLEEETSAATSKAETADQNAQNASQAAQGAQQTAEKGVTLANHNQQIIESFDSYQLVKSETVLFGVNHTELSDDAKQQLDRLTQSLPSIKYYAIEVQGFTDHTGSAQYNLNLSRRRADSVVRYVVGNGHVPLVKVHALGLGEDQPTGDNKTPDGRKQNRRVEIRVVAPPTTAPMADIQQQQTSAASQ